MLIFSLNINCVRVLVFRFFYCFFICFLLHSFFLLLLLYLNFVYTIDHRTNWEVKRNISCWYNNIKAKHQINIINTKRWWYENDARVWWRVYRDASGRWRVRKTERQEKGKKKHCVHLNLWFQSNMCASLAIRAQFYLQKSKRHTKWNLLKPKKATK